MRSFIFLVFFLCSVTTSMMAQSIRKNHNEMTSAEKTALVNAFVALKNGVFDDLRATHNNSFEDIHFNLRTTGGWIWEPEIDVFFPWHRRQMLELEQAMQNLNDKITIPYWDWRVDGSYNTAPGELWDDDFMGGFANPASGHYFNDISRSIGTPGYFDDISSRVNSVQNINPGTPPPNYNYYVNYSADMENTKPHTGGHIWVGGTMATRSSPGDPIFYLHHGMVDKLWQDWIEDNGFSSGTDMYTKTNMPRYDGTVSGVSSVNPDDLLDSKKFGVFYAQNGLAELYDYTVGQPVSTGITPNATAVFYYQYTIEAKNNFIVPSGKTALLESVNEVILKPGFHAQSGSSFTAKIDTDVNSLRVNVPQDLLVKTSKFLNYRIIEDVYSEKGIQKLLNAKAKILVDPKRKDNLELEFKEPCSPCEIEIVNAQNIIVLKQVLNQGKNIDINLNKLVKGTHFLRVIKNDNEIFNKELEKL